MPLALWRSWSEWGRLAASVVMNVAIEGVLPTTNHLESFNAILKRKHLKNWLHSGHRLRFDFLIHVLITRILPGVYGRRQAQRAYSEWLSARFYTHAGNRNLTDLHRHSKGGSKPLHTTSLCWWESDDIRESQARQIVQLKRLSIQRVDNDNLRAMVASSKANVQDPDHIRYTVDMHRSGVSSCTCMDFAQRGGACKHLRALRLCIEIWVYCGLETQYVYPLTPADARGLPLPPCTPIMQAQPTEFPLDLPTPDGDGCDTINPSSLHPTSHLPPPIVDFTVIQAMGDDHTTLGDQEDSASGSNSGEDQIAGSLDGVGMTTVVRLISVILLHLPCLTSFITKASHVDQHSGITLQIQSRIDLELQQLLPRLHGLANLMSDLKPPMSPTANVRDFDIVLQSLTTRLGQLTTGYGPAATDYSNATATAAAMQPITQMQVGPHDFSQLRSKRGRLLLPPSPERNAKRKNSHAPL